MEFDLKKWLNEILFKVKEHFKDRVLFVGYHGSYKRSEARADSDVDMVIILDNLELADLQEYRKIIQSLPHSEKACGFISGRKEIENWSKSDIFQFTYETESLYGNLEEIVSSLSTDDVKRTVKSSAEALYHAACHSYLFDGDVKTSLAGLLKMTFFIQQAQYFLKSNQYIPTKKELLPFLDGIDKIILNNSINRNLIETFEMAEVNELYEILIKWAAIKFNNYQAVCLMKIPNLFNYATKELSQDGFYTWLLNWANPKFKDIDKEINNTATEFVKLLVNCDITSVETHMQWNKIDITAIINNHFIIIEDKTFTSHHSNQLQKYKETAKKYCDEKKFILVPVYLKTGNEAKSGYDKALKLGYNVLGRKPILDILLDSKSKNNILIDYTNYLKKLEDDTNAFTDFDFVKKNGLATEGLYMYFEEKLGGGWHYVSNANGGFLGYFVDGSALKNGNLYVQLENNFKNGLQLKVKLVSESINIPTLHKISKAINFFGDKYSLHMVKPTKFRIGETCTVSEVKNVADNHESLLIQIKNLIELSKEYSVNNS